MINGAAAHKSKLEYVILGILALSMAFLYSTILLIPRSPLSIVFFRSSPEYMFSWSEIVSLPRTILSRTEFIPERQISTDILLQAAFERIERSTVTAEDITAEEQQLYLSATPGDLRRVADYGLRKDLFLRLMLPLILQVNDEVLIERHRLITLRWQIGQSLPLSRKDNEWLDNRFAYYHIEPTDGIDKLLPSIDVVPPSLALAQAALESGWGTSRLARKQNILFGQTTTSDDPQAIAVRDPARRIIYYKSFATPADAIRGYFRNLNSHPAYEDFRRMRAHMRAKGIPITGDNLVRTLKHYAEIAEYTEGLKQVIQSSALGELDETVLNIGSSVILHFLRP